MESKESNKEEKISKIGKKSPQRSIVKKVKKEDYVTKEQLRDQLSDFEKRMETKICYELKSVKFDILRWMIPFHMTTLAFMLTMLYRVFN